MKLVLFTLEEANRALQEIRPRVDRLVEAKREFDRVQMQLEVLHLATAGAAPSNPDAKALQQLHERRNTLAEQISHGVNAIQRRGALVKDLDRGLLDFYALMGDRLIFLCWQLGESEIKHWHTLEGGFSTRQPINHSELE